MGSDFKVKHDPTYVPVDLTLGMGEPGDDAPFQLEVFGARAEDAPPAPEEGTIVVSLGLVAKPGASDM